MYEEEGFVLFSKICAQKTMGCLINEYLFQLTILNKNLMCKVKCLFEQDVQSYAHKVHKACYMHCL
jgi:hypothetical protein